MYVKRLKDCRKFTAGDGSILREILHAKKGNFAFRYSLAHATLKAGKATKPHSLKTCETYYILEGKGRMHINNEARKVKTGDTIYIPPNSKQYIENTGNCDLKFLCIVDPAWRKEDEKVF